MFGDGQQGGPSGGGPEKLLNSSRRGESIDTPRSARDLVAVSLTDDWAELLDSAPCPSRP